jgi:hypothetical protein
MISVIFFSQIGSYSSYGDIKKLKFVIRPPTSEIVSRGYHELKKGGFMIKSLLVTALTLGGLLSSHVYAAGTTEPAEPTKVGIPLTTAYIPGGFDNNDRAQLVVEGYFPNTCYRVGPYEKHLDTTANELTVRQTAYKYAGNCLMMIVPFSQTIQVGILKASTYKVKDAENGAELGSLPIQTAKNSGPDDYVYANVNQAYVGVVDGNKKSIVLQGELPGDCWSIKEKRVLVDGKNVITVLPIIEKVRETNCNDYRLPFITTAEIPNVPAGRYLLHVRSLSGAAVNQLVDL